MNKKDLENQLASMRSGASLDYLASYSDREDKCNIYDVISQLLKTVQAYNTKELLKIVYDLTKNLSYCADCQRGFKDELIKKGICPKCDEKYQIVLKEMGL